jgi:predicted nucleic acid-binding protein
VSVYADSSFFVSLYVTDRHTPEVLRLLSRHPRIWFTPFHEVEIANAVAQQVYRGQITEDRAALTYLRLARHVSSGVWALAEFPECAFAKSAAMARSHVAQLGTRTLDSLHVACALELKADQFWTFDEKQAKLAKAAGLKVFN